MANSEVLEMYILLGKALNVFQRRKDLVNPNKKIEAKDLKARIEAKFGHMIKNVTIHDWFAERKVSGLDFDLHLKGNVFPIRMLTQNPNKKKPKRKGSDGRELTWGADLVQKGHDFTWILRRDKQGFQAWIWNNTYHNIVTGEDYIMEDSAPQETMSQYAQRIAAMVPHIKISQIEDVVKAASNVGMLK